MSKTTSSEKTRTLPSIRQVSKRRKGFALRPPAYGLDALDIPPAPRPSGHSRALPEEFKSKIAPGMRARTLEQTQIDLVGTGSALNSLVNSPAQTIGNAVQGLFSRFPSRATIQQQPVVQEAIGSAWASGLNDYHERFGWITWNEDTDAYAVPATSVGDAFSCTPPPKPADADPVFHVGEFHIHPPLDPSEPTMADPNDWRIGPSQADENAAQADHSPGIVRDFDTVARTGNAVDYTYGPWKRID